MNDDKTRAAVDRVGSRLGCLLWLGVTWFVAEGVFGSVQKFFEEVAIMLNGGPK